MLGSSKSMHMLARPVKDGNGEVLDDHNKDASL